MIDSISIPESEMKYHKNVSIIKYSFGTQTFFDRESIYNKFTVSKPEYMDNLQMLDNGTLIICQNRFGGRAIISEYTCGLWFCYQLLEYLIENETGSSTKIQFTMGADDHHSGWNYDFNIKLYNSDSIVTIVNDFDYKTSLEFYSEYFYINFYKFAYEIFTIFFALYPQLNFDSRYDKLEKVFNYVKIKYNSIE